ncbi:hypothetical protein [Methanobrevibacter sp.]
MAIIRVSGTCDSGSTPDRTISLFLVKSLVMIFEHLPLIGVIEET